MVFTPHKNLSGITVGKQNHRFFDLDGVLFDKIENLILHYPAGKQDTCYTIPDGVSIIGKRAFSGCKNLMTVYIPDTVTVIGSFVFSDCNNLKTVYISRKISIPKYAFENIFENSAVKIFYTD
jgi:hypothetical protein